MAYFLGRDVTVNITTEDGANGVEVDISTGGVSIYDVGIVTGASFSATGAVAPTDVQITTSGSGYTGFPALSGIGVSGISVASFTAGSSDGTTWSAVVDDPSSGITATVSGTLVGGALDEVIITNPGSGYDSAGVVPDVTVTTDQSVASTVTAAIDALANTITVAAPTETAGTTAVVNLVNGGSGYETTDTITGSGSTTVRTTTDANFATGRLYAGSGAASVANVLGIDLSIGAMDEDITYMGKRTVQKVEVKKETNITLTRKKQDMSWDAIFNSGYRWGISGTTRNDGLSEPDIYHGYRLVLDLSGSAGREVMTIRNACIAGHGESLNADGTTDETMEFYSYVEPVVSGSAASGATSLSDM